MLYPRYVVTKKNTFIL